MDEKPCFQQQLVITIEKRRQNEENQHAYVSEIKERLFGGVVTTTTVVLVSAS